MQPPAPASQRSLHTLPYARLICDGASVRILLSNCGRVSGCVYAQASFEETVDILFRAAIYAEKDTMQVGPGGRPQGGRMRKPWPDAAARWVGGRGVCVLAGGDGRLGGGGWQRMLGGAGPVPALLRCYGRARGWPPLAPRLISSPAHANTSPGAPPPAHPHPQRPFPLPPAPCRQGVSENIMLGQLCPVGTGAFSLLLDEKKLADAHDLDLQAYDQWQDAGALGLTPGRTPGERAGGRLRVLLGAGRRRVGAWSVAAPCRSLLRQRPASSVRCCALGAVAWVLLPSSARPSLPPHQQWQQPNRSPAAAAAAAWPAQGGPPG